MTTIHHYDPATGAFLGSSPATESPLEPGVFLVPANATTIAPPAVGADEVALFREGAWTVAADLVGQVFYRPDGTNVTIAEVGQVPDPAWTTAPPPAAGDHQVAVLTDGVWAVVADYVGQTFYKPDGTKVTISEIGQSPDPAWTMTVPPTAGTNQIAVLTDGAWTVVANYVGQTFYRPDGSEVTISEVGQRPDPDWSATPLTVAQVQAWQIAILKTACATEIVGGFPSSALGAAAIYASDSVSQANLQQTVLSPAGGCLWNRGEAWAFTPHSQTQAEAVLTDFIAFRNDRQQRLAALTAKVEAATTVDAVKAVLWADVS